MTRIGGVGGHYDSLEQCQGTSNHDREKEWLNDKKANLVNGNLEAKGQRVTLVVMPSELSKDHHPLQVELTKANEVLVADTLHSTCILAKSNVEMHPPNTWNQSPNLPFSEWGWLKNLPPNTFFPH
ncbi:hypothetical protein ACLOJK_024326 [Asimina triloba]